MYYRNSVCFSVKLRHVKCFPCTEANQQKIVEAGGLGSLLGLLQNSQDETIRRVAAGAVANLAMNGIGLLISITCNVLLPVC
jgi:hypothetical protein